MILAYFMFGAGFYIGLALKNPRSFMSVDAASLIRGFLLGVVFWPVGLIVQTYLTLKGLDK